MTDTTSNPQTGFDWEDVCLDPHNGSLEQGKAQGREAGALAGFQDGRTLGQNKGLEFGLEVGFYHGVVSALVEESDNGFGERVRKSIHKLQEAIDAFPSPDEVFSNARDDSTMKAALETSTSSSSKNVAGGDLQEHDSEDPSKFDIIKKLQRIRARFKLLVVQLGKPQFSLRNSLEGREGNTAISSGEEGEDGW